MRIRTKVGLLSLIASAGATGATLFACSQTPTPVPIRTFERAQKMDVVCLQVGTADGNPIVPVPLAQDQCIPVPPGVDGTPLLNHLFALVTQTTRGELAVVDLTAGGLIDQSKITPGVNFLTVGELPTDVAVSPDGKMVFVAAAEVNKAAIYAIPSRRILGQTGGVAPDPDGTPTLTSWPVCRLPQNPGALAIVPRRQGTTAPADAGAGDAGDAGTPTTAPPPDYDIVAVLPGDHRSSAKIVTIDPRPFMRGAHVDIPNDPGGATIEPGALAPCIYTSAKELTGGAAVPTSASVGTEWPDGVPWVDGGVDLTCQRPELAQSCGTTCCAGGDASCVPTAPVNDGGITLALGELELPRAVAVARDDQILYVADSRVPLIHVMDISVPEAPRELPPLLTTSLVDPARVVTVKDLAISPATRDYQRFLYAVDREAGTIMVFDVTDPNTTKRTPMTRPHPELNPFQPPDRIAFNAPVAAIAFARNDFQRKSVNSATFTGGAPGGVLCNPNPRIDGDPEAQPGFFYRPSSTDISKSIDPARLRGIFAFATLTNGQVATINVDDWDAPCRRPAVLTGKPVFPNDLAVAQQDFGDLDPYHAPNATIQSTTDEAFYPVSAPHSLRSFFFLRDDSATGKHIPYLSGPPNVGRKGQALPVSGPDSAGTPRLRPTTAATATTTGDAGASSDIGISFSFESPEAHVDQDWTVAYEGALPGFDGLSGVLSSTDYKTLTLTHDSGHFCSKGVEDLAVGLQRSSRIKSALPVRSEAEEKADPRDDLDTRLVDYVQLSDDLLPPEDPYWGVNGPNNEPAACWAGTGNSAQERYHDCAVVFGNAADESPTRDFPILEAYDDHLVLGRFYGAANGGRQAGPEAVSGDQRSALRLAQCCFHNQPKFRVRPAVQWVAIGSIFGALNHIVRASGGRCVASCDSREALLNSRTPALPFLSDKVVPTRNSPLAVRTPEFSFYVVDGSRDNKDLLPARDTAWRFSTRGGFQTLTVAIAGSSTAVDPQSMRFINSLGQIAVVDATAQGLVLIDLSAVTIARAPYF